MQVQELPTVPGDFFTGHAKFFQKEMLDFFGRLTTNPNPLIRMNVFSLPVIFVNSPDLVHELLVEHSRSVEKSLALRTALYPLAGNGLFTSESAIWKPQRKLMAPLFQPSYLSEYIPTMYRCALRVADSLKDGQTIDIAKEMTRITMNVAGQTLFGADTFDESDELGQALNLCLDVISKRTSSPQNIIQAFSLGIWKQLKSIPEPIQKKVAGFLFDPPLIPTQLNKQFQEALQLLNEKAQQMIDARRREGLTRKDLLTRLLGARDENNQRMDDKQVRDETMTLFIAGHETTSNSLSWCWHELTQNPGVYKKLQTEADLFDESALSVEALDSLPYALQVFKESLRKYPPVPAFDRQAQEDITVGDVLLPRGTVCFVSPYTMQHNEKHYPNPEKFDPERFTHEQEAKRHKYAFLPFGGGPRTCIGNFFAMMEGQIALTVLAKRFTFERVKSHQVEPTQVGLLKPQNGVMVKVKARPKTFVV
jgi:cytochrome P450